MTREHKHKPKAVLTQGRNLSKGRAVPTAFNCNYDFIFSNNIDDWYGGKLHRQRQFYAKHIKPRAFTEAELMQQ